MKKYRSNIIRNIKLMSTLFLTIFGTRHFGIGSQYQQKQREKVCTKQQIRRQKNEFTN
jgi:hypothetical protein